MHLQIEDEKAKLKAKLSEAADNSNLVVVEVSYSADLPILSTAAVLVQFTFKQKFPLERLSLSPHTVPPFSTTLPLQHTWSIAAHLLR